MSYIGKISKKINVFTSIRKSKYKILNFVKKNFLCVKSLTSTLLIIKKCHCMLWLVKFKLVYLHFQLFDTLALVALFRKTVLFSL